MIQTSLAPFPGWVVSMFMMNNIGFLAALEAPYLPLLVSQSVSSVFLWHNFFHYITSSTIVSVQCRTQFFTNVVFVENLGLLLFMFCYCFFDIVVVLLFLFCFVVVVLLFCCFVALLFYCCFVVVLYPLTYLPDIPFWPSYLTKKTFSSIQTLTRAASQFLRCFFKFFSFLICLSIMMMLANLACKLSKKWL